MSDTRETIADLISAHVPDLQADGRVHCAGCLVGPDADPVGFATYWGFSAHLVDLIDVTHLVVPRSDIVGTEYGLRYSEPGEEPTVMEDCRSGAAASLVRSVRRRQAANGLEPNAEFLSRPVLPWTPIPLPEDGDSHE